MDISETLHFQELILKSSDVKESVNFCFRGLYLLFKVYRRVESIAIKNKDF